MERGRELGTAGAGNVGGGGKTAVCDRLRAGNTRGVAASARCNSAWAFRAFCWLGLAGAGNALGLMSAVCGKLATGRILKLGSAGFIRTLPMSIAARLVTTIAVAIQIRRTRLQRRPAGS